MFKTLALVALSAFLCLTASAPFADARLAPTSFLAKNNVLKQQHKQQLKQQQHHNANVKNADTKAISIPSGGSFGSASFEVKLSYWLDVLGGLAMVTFAYFWAQSISASKASPATYPFFEKSVLKDGFCNKDFGSIAKKYLTQKMCFIADCIMVVVSFFDAKSKGLEKKPMYLVYAIYTIIHGIVHLSVFKNPASSSGPINLTGLAIMAVIIVIGPAALYTVLDAAPKIKNKKIVLPISGIFWVACVAAYGLIFKEKQFALTYINVLIFLALFVPRALLIGTKDPEDIAAREKYNAAFPNFWIGQIATVAALFILCAEPFFCAGWFGEAGGHLLFDIALYFYYMSQVLIGA